MKLAARLVVRSLDVKAARKERALLLIYLAGGMG
jgi:hypothetical protein